MTLKKSLAELRQKILAPGRTNPHVQWLSFHIPKTAGTSFRKSLEEGLGSEKIQHAYDASPIHSRLKQGRQVWVPASRTIVHGHFPADPKLKEIFPNARWVVWVRDPVDRTFSLLQHWLMWNEHQNFGNRFFRLFHERHMQTERTIEELLIRMLTDKDLLPATHALTRYLGRVERQDFAFVGRTETFETDLDRFASLAEIQLRDKRLNVSDLIPNKDKLDRESFQKLLVEEYDTLERFLKD